MRKCAATKSFGCKNRRKPISFQGYRNWHTVADRRTEAGWTQERCPGCRRFTRWFTPAESRRMAKKKRVEEDRVDPRKIASSNQFDKLYEVAESCLKIAESRRRDKTKVKLIKKKLKESLDGSS